MEKKLTYYTDPGFWNLLLRLIPYLSKDGKVSGTRISFEEFKILLWRYHGKLTQKECSQLLGKHIGRERIRQKECRALNIIKQLFINRYNKSLNHTAYLI